ncbi:hypothetical protein BH11PAT2_BH11PAT2_00120 [soil metagenome]
MQDMEQGYFGFKNEWLQKDQFGISLGHVLAYREVSTENGPYGTTVIDAREQGTCSCGWQSEMRGADGREAVHREWFEEHLLTVCRATIIYHFLVRARQLPLEA